MKLILMLGKPNVTESGGKITLTGGPGKVTFFEEMGLCGTPIPHQFAKCDKPFRPGTLVVVTSTGNMYRGQKFIVEARFSDHADRVICKSADKLNHFSYSFRCDELEVVDEVDDDPLVCPAKGSSDLDRGHNFMNRPDHGTQECIACGHQIDTDDFESQIAPWQEFKMGGMWWYFKRDDFSISISKFVDSIGLHYVYLHEKKNDGIYYTVAANRMNLPDKNPLIVSAIKWAEDFLTKP